jgi:hypothetical protein
MKVVREFETTSAAIALAKKFAAKLGNGEFEPGPVLTVLDEFGEVVVEIQVKRLHS